MGAGALSFRYRFDGRFVTRDSEFRVVLWVQQRDGKPEDNMGTEAIYTPTQELVTVLWSDETREYYTCYKLMDSDGNKFWVDEALLDDVERDEI